MDSQPAAEGNIQRRQQNMTHPHPRSSPAVPLSSPSPRRLAPQRKKAPIASIVNVPRVDVDVEVANRFDDRCYSPCEEDEEEGEEEEEEEEKGGRVRHKITSNVADWTLLDANHRNNCSTNTKSIYPSLNESGYSKENEDGEDSEEEFHGEIESIASSSRSKLTDEPKEDVEMDGFIQIITEEHIPLHPPPPTLPLVLVNLEALTGCAPKTDADKSILLRQLMEALLGTPSNENDNTSDDQEHGIDNEHTSMLGEKGNVGDGLSLHFDERVMELFESGVAYHVDSSHPIARTCMMTSSEKDEEVQKEKGEAIVDSENTRKVHPYAIVPYPEFLVELQQESTTTSTTLRSSLRLWKLLQTTPTAAATDTATSQHQKDSQMSISCLLSRIFSHLRNCSRSLIWKANMHIELCRLAKEEYKLQIKRQQTLEYNEWNDSVRRLRLDKLYDVRETFEVQVRTAKKKYDLLAQEREKRVEIELLRRRRQRGEKGGHFSIVCGDDGRISNDVDSNVCDDVKNFFNDDSGWEGRAMSEDEILGHKTSFVGQSQFGTTIQINDDGDDDEIAADENDDEKVNDEWSPLEVNIKSNPSGMQIVLDGVVQPKKSSPYEDGNVEIQEASRTGDDKNNIGKMINLEPISHDDNLRRISHRLLKRRHLQGEQNIPPHYDATPSTINEQHLEYLRKEEDSIREMLRTNDERIAESTLLKFEERLRNVDELLESLQEEEWADDEEGDVEDDDEGDYGRGDEDFKDGGEMPSIDPPRPATFSSLLDQILAMILGALPKEICRTLQEANSTDADHYRYIKEEHESIIKEWIEIFGCLPPLPRLKPLPEKETNAENISVDENKFIGMPFGDDFTSSKANIVSDSNEKSRCIAGPGHEHKDFTPIDNDGSNWDEVEDWDALFPLKTCENSCNNISMLLP
jgi:hypothetical protein